MTITIYHNPRCGTSRKVLAALTAAGHDPVIVDYLKTPLDAAALTALIAKTGAPARALLREKEEACARLGLADPALSDADLIAAMVAEPVLMNRPVVETGARALLCRPAERVAEILPETAAHLKS